MVRAGFGGRTARLASAVGVALLALLAFGAAGSSAGVYLGAASEFTDQAAPANSKPDAATAPGKRDGRIVGGGLATIEQYPWQVALTMNPNFFGGTARDRQFCGGTAVAPTIIVSAAHCTFDNQSGFFLHPDNFAVLSGRTTLTGSGGRETQMEDYYFFLNDNGTPGNPNDDSALYNPNTNEYDVIVIQLESASAATPVKIAGPDETALWSAGRNALISGWGNTSEGGTSSDTLKSAQIPMLADSSCSTVYDGGPDAQGLRYFPSVMACAGVLSGGTDTCQGDSGGPLVVPTSAGELRLVGVVSFGLGCARTGFPGVYARVASDPIRGGVAQIAQSLAGVNVVGSGGQPPAPPAPPGPSAQCTKAQKQFTKAKRKVKRAKSKLAKARDNGSRKKVKRAKSKLKSAKKKRKQAKKKVKRNC